MLSINLRCRRAEIHHAVVVTPRGVEFGYAHQQVAAVAPPLLCERFQIFTGNVHVEHWQRRLWQQDQFGFGRFRQIQIRFKCGARALRPPLHLLRDIALQKRNAGRLAGQRLGPFPGAQCGAGDQQGHDDPRAGSANQQRHPPLLSLRAPFGQARDDQSERRRDDRRGQRNTEHTEHRREARQRAAGRLRVTNREPREAGEQPTAHPLRQRPQRREQDQQAHRFGGRQTFENRPDQGRITGRDRAE